MGVDKLVDSDSITAVAREGGAYPQPEITEKMEWIGWEILFSFDIDKDSLKGTVRKIYSAMYAARPVSNSPMLSGQIQSEK